MAEVPKVLIVDDNSFQYNYFSKLFVHWGVEVQVVKEPEQTLIKVNIFKPKYIFISSQLKDADYKHIMPYLVDKNYQFISYGPKNINLPKTKLHIKHLASPPELDFYELKKLIFPQFQIPEHSGHFEMTINEEIGMIELEGLVPWERIHEICFQLVFLLEQGEIMGAVFIFHILENPDAQINEYIQDLMWFLTYVDISPNCFKFISLDKRVVSAIKSLPEEIQIENVKSYAEAYLKLQSIKLDRKAIGLDVEFVREDMLLFENVYDKNGKLLKKAGENFTAEEIKQLKSLDVKRIFYAKDLSALGIQLNEDDIAQEVESIIIRQVDESDKIKNIRHKDSGGTVYIIDDDENLRKLLEKLVEKMGYTPQSVDSARDALDQLKEFVPDLILLDLMMNDLNGVEFIKRYKRLNVIEAPIIVVSAINRKEVIQKLLKMGIRDYVLKPINMQNFAEKVKKILK